MAAFLRYKSDQKLVFSYDHCRIQIRTGRPSAAVPSYKPRHPITTPAAPPPSSPPTQLPKKQKWDHQFPICPATTVRPMRPLSATKTRVSATPMVPRQLRRWDPRQQASRSGPAPRWDTGFPYLRESGLPRGETFYLHFSATAQPWRKDNYTRNSRLPRYKTLFPATTGLVFRLHDNRPLPHPSATGHFTSSRVSRHPAAPALRPFPYSALSTSRPFLVLPFPYPGSLCIMSPYPPQHQEHTSS